jgi:hypothetical protein
VEHIADILRTNTVKNETFSKNRNNSIFASFLPILATFYELKITFLKIKIYFFFKSVPPPPPARPPKIDPVHIYGPICDLMVKRLAFHIGMENSFWIRSVRGYPQYFCTMCTKPNGILINNIFATELLTFYYRHATNIIHGSHRPDLDLSLRFLVINHTKKLAKKTLDNRFQTEFYCQKGFNFVYVFF